MRSRFTRGVLCALLLIGLPLRAQADSITVGSQTGAQIFFNNTLSRTYNFGVTQTGAQNDLAITAIDVNVKGSNAPSAPVIVNVYSGLGGTGTVLASGTISQSTLTTQFQFLNLPISPLSLPTGGYSVQLTTAATENYYIKNGSTRLTTNGTAAVTSSWWVEDTNTTGSAGTTLNAASTVIATYTLGTNAFQYGNYRVGASLTGTTPLINTALATSNNVTQDLAVLGASSGGVNSLTGLPSPYLAVGGTANIIVGLNGSTTGPNSGTASLSFSSVPGASATTGTTAVGNGAIVATGTGYDWANAVYSGTTFNFGIIHQGGVAASGTAAIGNQTVVNGSYQDSLNVSASTGNALVAATGFAGLAASAGGATRGDLVVAIGTGTAGSLNSTLALTLASNANGVAGLSDGTATVVGSPGAITTTGTVYSGQSTWATNGSGQWGTLVSSFGTNWAGFTGSPGLDAGFVDTDTATFGGVVTSGTATVTISAAAPSVKSVTFANPVASYVIAGASGGALTLLNSGTQAATVAVTAGGHVISVPITLASQAALDVAAGSELFLDGPISGENSVTKEGAGTVTLSGNNSYSEGTTINAGVVAVAAAGALGTTGTISFGGGTLRYSAGNTSDYSARFSTNGGQQYRIDTNGQEVTFGTSLSSSGGSFTKLGSGTATLTGANSYSGGTTISAGAIQVGDGGASGSLGGGDVANNATLIFNRSDDILVANGISGSGSVVKLGAGRLELTGSTSYSGPTTVQAGEFKVNGVLASTLVTTAAYTTLSGTGVLGGDVTVQGIHAPGNSPGIQTVGGNLTYSGSQSSVVWELTANAADPAGRGVTYDGIDVGGDLSFAAPTELILTFNGAGSTVNWNDAFWGTVATGTDGWLLYDVLGTTTGVTDLAISGTTWIDAFGNSFADVRPGSTFGIAQIGNDVYITLVAVPEPSTAILLGIGLGASFLTRRSCRRRATMSAGAW